MEKKPFSDDRWKGRPNEFNISKEKRKLSPEKEKEIDDFLARVVKRARNGEKATKEDKEWHYV